MATKRPLVHKSAKAYEAQGQFLRAVSKDVPAVVAMLRADVLPRHRDLPPFLKNKTARGPVYRDEMGDWVRVPELVLIRNLNHYAGKSALARALRDALMDWGIQFNLTDEWLLDAALYTIHRWAIYTGELEKSVLPRSWDNLVRVPVEDPLYHFQSEGLRFNFQCGWYPDLEPWSRFKKMTTAAFNVQLEKYQKEVLALAKERGLVAEPEHREKNHFKWLALYQCTKGTTLNKLAKGLKQPPNTVFMAVKRLASQIGLTLRPAKT